MPMHVNASHADYSGMLPVYSRSCLLKGLFSIYLRTDTLYEDENILYARLK